MWKVEIKFDKKIQVKISQKYLLTCLHPINIKSNIPEPTFIYFQVTLDIFFTYLIIWNIIFGNWVENFQWIIGYTFTSTSPRTFQSGVNVLELSWIGPKSGYLYLFIYFFKKIFLGFFNSLKRLVRPLFMFNLSVTENSAQEKRKLKSPSNWYPFRL